MIEFIKKVISGFALGLGFSVALALISMVSMKYVVGEMYEESVEATTESMFRSYNPDDNKLIIENEKSEKDHDGIVVTGVVRNADDVAWSSVKIEVELFDKDGSYVHECSEYISQSIKPEASENFKVSCKGCSKSKIPEFETYKIKIVGAHFTSFGS